MNKFSLVITAVAAFTLSGTAQAANLITNGGFEAPQFTGAPFLASLTGSALPGWTIDVGTVDLLSSANSGGHYPASSGTQSIDLSGSSGTTDNSLFQDFATEIGKSYNFSFVVLASTDLVDPQNAKTFSTQFTFADTNNLSNVLFTDTASHINTDMNWLPVSGSFTAASISTRIRFTDTSNVVNQGVYLDDVSVEVSAVPEAATWAMMLIGFGGVGLSVRSRNRRTMPTVAA